MKVHDCQQGSCEWLMLRCGIPTASELDALITPLGKIRAGDTPRAYLARKLAEWWGHTPMFGGGFWNADQGHILEQEAKPWYTLEYGVEIANVGFVTTDDGRIGCSPDGLIGDSSGIEIKCPEPHTHVSYLLAGEVPPQYVAQVQGNMLVCECDEWRFMSYRRMFPNLVLTVPRDDKFQENLKSALEQFLDKFEQGKERLIKLNGGAPIWPQSDDSPNPDYHIDAPDDVTP